MKTKVQLVKLQQITAFIAIIAAPMPVLAVGPAVAGWIPGAEILDTVAPLTTYLQPGPYKARDTYKVFVADKPNYDLQVVVTGSAGVKVDYFDEIETNGLYAIFGAVDAGTITLNYQWRTPKGSGPFVNSGETKVLTVGPQKTMNHDTEVHIAAIWDAKNAIANPTPAQIQTRLNTDFPNMKADGFTLTRVAWKPAWDDAKTTIYDNYTQHAMKATQELYAAGGYVEANMYYPPPGYGYGTHNNVPLLGLESALNTDMLADVGSASGTQQLKNHAQLFSYYLIDECKKEFLRGQELMAMLAKNIDPDHASGASSGGLHGSFTSDNIAQTSFSDFLTVNLYPLADSNIRPCPNCPAAATSDFSHSNWQPGQYDYIDIPTFMDWATSFDTRRPLEIIVQTHHCLRGGPPDYYGSIRFPSPKELRALVMIAAAHGSRPFNYFIYGWFGRGQPGSCYGLLDDNPAFGRTPQLDEAKLVNEQLATWIPTYKNLKVSAIGSTPITYSYSARSPIVGNFVHNTTLDRYLIAVNTDTVNTKTLTINGVRNKADTGNATTAKDVVSGTEYNIAGGTLTLPGILPGDGIFLQVGSAKRRRNSVCDGSDTDNPP